MFLEFSVCQVNVSKLASLRYAELQKKGLFQSFANASLQSGVSLKLVHIQLLLRLLSLIMHFKIFEEVIVFELFSGKVKLTSIHLNSKKTY